MYKAGAHPCYCQIIGGNSFKARQCNMNMLSGGRDSASLEQCNMNICWVQAMLVCQGGRMCEELDAGNILVHSLGPILRGLCTNCFLCQPPKQFFHANKQNTGQLTAPHACICSDAGVHRV